MTRLDTTTGKAAAQPAGLLSRWVDELAHLLPRRKPTASWHALLMATPTGLDFYLTDKSGAPHLAGTLDSTGTLNIPARADRKQFARYQKNADGLALRLAANDVIQKTLSIPAAAGDVIAPIVQNQIEMISPWPIERALYDWQIVPSTGSEHAAVHPRPQLSLSHQQKQQLNVNVAVAGRAVVEQLLEIAQSHGISPAKIDFGDVADPPTSINFLRERSTETVRGRGLVQGALLLLTIAAISAAGIGLIQAFEQREALTWVNERVGAAERRAAATHKVSANAAQLEARYRIASDEKYRSIPATGMLEAVSRTLPDGTWLNRLEMRNGTLRMIGNSSDATALIGLIEASPFFTAARFAAPVTPGPGGQKFTIEAIAAENLDVAALLRNSAPQPSDTGQSDALAADGHSESQRRQGSEQ